MALIDSVKLRIGIKDDLQDDLLNEIITDAQARVMAYINQDGANLTTLPSGVEYIVKEIAVRMYNKIGDEGKSSSKEGEITNQWATINLAEYADALDIYRPTFTRRRAGMRFI